jgi:hypothetical protein
VPHASPFLPVVGVSAGFIFRWSAAVRVVALILFSAFLLSGASPEKHLSVYSIAANYSLPVVQRESRDYVGLLELLEPLGKVTAKVDGSRWRLHYNNVQAEFQVNKTRARVQDRAVWFRWDRSARCFREFSAGLCRSMKSRIVSSSAASVHISPHRFPARKRPSSFFASARQ